MDEFREFLMGLLTSEGPHFCFKANVRSGELLTVCLSKLQKLPVDRSNSISCLIAIVVGLKHNVIVRQHSDPATTHQENCSNVLSLHRKDHNGSLRGSLSCTRSWIAKRAVRHSRNSKQSLKIKILQNISNASEAAMPVVVT